MPTTKLVLNAVFKKGEGKKLKFPPGPRTVQEPCPHLMKRRGELEPGSPRCRRTRRGAHASKNPRGSLGGETSPKNKGQKFGKGANAFINDPRQPRSGNSPSRAAPAKPLSENAETGFFLSSAEAGRDSLPSCHPRAPRSPSEAPRGRRRDGGRRRRRRGMKRSRRRDVSTRNPEPSLEGRNFP